MILAAPIGSSWPDSDGSAVPRWLRAESLPCWPVLHARRTMGSRAGSPGPESHGPRCLLSLPRCRPGHRRRRCEKRLRRIAQLRCAFCNRRWPRLGHDFEIGYARALNKPVVFYAENESEQGQKMIEGSDCTITDDYVSAVYRHFASANIAQVVRCLSLLAWMAPRDAGLIASHRALYASLGMLLLKFHRVYGCFLHAAGQRCTRQ